MLFGQGGDGDKRCKQLEEQLRSMKAVKEEVENRYRLVPTIRISIHITGGISYRMHTV